MPQNIELNFLLTKEFEAMKRLFIEAGDIQSIHQISERQARNILAKIRAFFKKEKHQRVTFNDYCCYHGVTYEEIAGWIS